MFSHAEAKIKAEAEINSNPKAEIEWIDFVRENQWVDKGRGREKERVVRPFDLKLKRKDLENMENYYFLHYACESDECASKLSFDGKVLRNWPHDVDKQMLKTFWEKADYEAEPDFTCRFSQVRECDGIYDLKSTCFNDYRQQQHLQISVERQSLQYPPIILDILDSSYFTEQNYAICVLAEHLNEAAMEEPKQQKEEAKQQNHYFTCLFDELCTAVAVEQLHFVFDFLAKNHCASQNPEAANNCDQSVTASADDTSVWLDLKGDVMQCVYNEKKMVERQNILLSRPKSPQKEDVYSRLCKLAGAVYLHFYGMRVDA
jgi:hypothetical protein